MKQEGARGRLRRAGGGRGCRWLPDSHRRPPGRGGGGADGEGGSIARSGNLASGIDHYLAVPGEGPWDTPEEFMSNVPEVNEYLVDMDAAEVFAREVGGMVRYLESIGIPFRDKRTGQYRRVPGLGSQRPRLINPDGGEVKKILAREVHRPGVRVVERVAVQDLLTRGQEVVGGVAVVVRGGNLHVFRAKAVVLATGVAVRLYPTPSGLAFMSHHCPYNTGEGQARAFRTGARAD